MKFCANCGKEIDEKAVVCVHCGCAVKDNTAQVQANAPQEEENKNLANCALGFAFLIPIVGLILGIMGTVKYKTQKLKNQCIAAIPVSLVVWAISAAVMFSM